MNKSLEIFTKSLEGVWASQQTIYDFTNKTISINILEIDICMLNQVNRDKLSYSCHLKNKNNKKNTYIYSVESDLNSVPGTLKKIYNDKILRYKFIIHSNNYLKIQYRKNHLLYTEYVYLIHKNIKLSIVVIKKFCSYIGTCFISDIKIKNN